MYVYGKGKTATSVTAPDTVVTYDSGIIIKGTVLDMSPAQEDTPCVPRESMTTQMEYLAHATSNGWHLSQLNYNRCSNIT